jgi:hypothetical protein
MTTDEINALQKELARALGGTPGVWGVGVSREGGAYALVVSVDSGTYTGGAPAAYKGVVVRTEDLSATEPAHPGRRTVCDPEIEALSDEAAVRAVGAVAKSWFDERGWDAHLAVSAARAAPPADPLPGWLSAPETDLPAAGKAARALLTAIAEGDDPVARGWVDAALRSEGEGRGHCLDTLAIGVGGAILIGLILAARVERVHGKDVRFYQGLPKQLGDLVRKAAKPFLP